MKIFGWICHDLTFPPWNFFLLGHTWRFHKFWEQFSYFSAFLFSLVNEPQLEKQLLVSSSNGRAGNSLDLPTSLGNLWKILWIYKPALAVPWKLQALEGGRSKVILEWRMLSLGSRAGAWAGWISLLGNSGAANSIPTIPFYILNHSKNPLRAGWGNVCGFVVKL